MQHCNRHSETGEVRFRGLACRLSRRLAAYSLAAGAGVATTDRAAAAPIPFVPPGGPIVVEANYSNIDYNVPVDIDGDGGVDYGAASYAYFGNVLSFVLEGYIDSNRINRLMVATESRLVVIAPGGAVGPSAGLVYSSRGFLDNFVDNRGYAGLLFDIPGGSPHFAYLDVEVKSATQQLFIYGGAYESEASTAITTPVPEPHGLCLLAAGAAGLVAWRKRRH